MALLGKYELASSEEGPRRLFLHGGPVWRTLDAPPFRYCTLPNVNLYVPYPFLPRRRDFPVASVGIFVIFNRSGDMASYFRT